MLLSVPKTWNLSRAKIVLLALLTTLVLLGEAPGYLAGGKWRWAAPPEVSGLEALRQIKSSGLAIPGWQTKSGKPSEWVAQWYEQDVVQAQQTAKIFFLPQASSKQQPQVEWTDIAGMERWKSDSYQTLNLNLDQQSGQPGIHQQATTQQLTTRFFRAWTKSKTYAVVQWYAQPTGGTPVPSQWYVADRLAQWQGRRVPWVAVNIQLPMEPLDDLGKYQLQAEAIAKAVQSGLMTGALKS